MDKQSVNNDDIESIKAVFRCFDHNQSKTIPLEMLLQVLVQLDPSLDRQVLVNLLELADVVSNGDVKYEKFVDFVRPKFNAEITPSNGGASPAPAASLQPPGAEARKLSKAEEDARADAEERAKIDAMKNAPRRVSVSAKKISDEAMKDYKKPVHEKDEAAKEILRNTLKSNAKLDVICGSLGQDAVEDIVNAFYSKTFESGADIIKQGEDGDCLYIIAKGTVDIFVARKDESGQINTAEKGGKVCSWTDGALFGELALMYSAPRAATVTADGPVSTFVLDALDFKMLLASQTDAEMMPYDGWLCQVKLFESLNTFELGQLADELETDCFDGDDDIIVQGDEECDKFYLLEDGEAVALMTGDDGEKQVKEFQIGDHFGEIELLTTGPRKATVRAKGQGCSVSYLPIEKFESALGPIIEKLRAAVQTYKY